MVATAPFYLACFPARFCSPLDETWVEEVRNPQSMVLSEDLYLSFDFFAPYLPGVGFFGLSDGQISYPEPVLCRLSLSCFSVSSILSMSSLYFSFIFS